MKIETYVEKQKGRGYKYPFKLSVIIRDDVGIRYTAFEDLTRRLEINEQDYITQVHNFKGEFFGSYKHTFFKNRASADKFIEGFLTPYIIAQRLRGSMRKKFGRHTTEAIQSSPYVNQHAFTAKF